MKSNTGIDIASQKDFENLLQISLAIMSTFYFIALYTAKHVHLGKNGHKLAL